MSPETIAETILVISASSQQAEQVKNAINLRGQESIETTTFDQASEVVQQLKPVLSIVDLAILAENQIPFVQHLSKYSPVLVLAPEFQEDYFFNVYDAGAKDYLVKPVPEAYMAARILSILENRRTLKLLEDRENILKNYNVISKRCQAFTTNHIIELIKDTSQKVSDATALSLILVDVSATINTLPKETQKTLYPPIVSILNSCARGNDLIGEYMEGKFLILMPGTRIDGAESLRNRLQEKLSAVNIQHQDHTLNLNPAIGIANYSGCGHYEDFIEKAAATKTTAGKASIAHPF